MAFMPLINKNNLNRFYYSNYSMQIVCLQAVLRFWRKSKRNEKDLTNFAGVAIMHTQRILNQIIRNR